MNRGRWHSLALLLFACFSFACPNDDAAGRPVLNRCAQSFECGAVDQCNAELGICEHRGVQQTYEIALQIIPDNAVAGPSFARTIRAAEPLQGSVDFGTIRIRKAVVVSGSVVDMVDNKERPVRAEVAFSPRNEGYLAAGVSAFTQPVDDGGQLFVAVLAPETEYTVKVFPRGADSELLPPIVFTHTTTAVDQTAKFSYLRPQVSSWSATLVDESQKPADTAFSVRLREKKSGQFVSSVGKIRAGGAFEIRAPEALLTPSALAQHELVLDVKRRSEPKLAEIVFPGERLRSGAKLVLPIIPDPVLFAGTVEIAELPDAKPDENTVNANLTFVSNFEPLPSDVTGADWCRLRLPGSPQGTFTCGATVTASVGADRKVVASLLPGSYTVFVAPTGDINDRQRVATTSLMETISIQPNGTQEGRVFGLSRSVLYSGTVLSPALKPMPAVTVTANALRLKRDLPEVALYNRTAAQVSDGRGDFRLAVDTGYYDLIAEPPEDSGFSWVLFYNRRIGMEEGQASTGPVEPQIPVIAEGQLQTTDFKPVAGARVEAFAVVPELNPDMPGQRAVRIARATSDAEGNFALLLPQFIGELDGGPTDGGMAGTQAMPDASAPDASSPDAGVADAGRR